MITFAFTIRKVYPYKDIPLVGYNNNIAHFEALQYAICKFPERLVNLKDKPFTFTKDGQGWEVL